MNSTKQIQSCVLVLTLIFLCAANHWKLQAAQESGGVQESIPAETLAELQRVENALRLVYLEFTELWIDSGKDFVDAPKPKAYLGYFERNNFYGRVSTSAKERGKDISQSTEFSFDGRLVYTGDINSAARSWAILTKYSSIDNTDPSRTKRNWEFPYLNAASFYVPERISELQRFSSIEPLVTHYLKQSESTKVDQSGEYLRIAMRVPDDFLIAAREMDLKRRREELEYRRLSPALVTKEIGLYERLQNISPTRTVIFTLDPKHGYGVVEREELTAKGERMVLVRSEDWKFYQKESVWLPNRCTVLYYNIPYTYEGFSQQAIATNITELTKVEFTQKNISFALDQKSDYQKPGTAVVDRSVLESRDRPNHHVTYRVAANGKLLRDSVNIAISKMSNTKRTVMICVFLVILGIPPILLLARHNKTVQKGGRA